MDDVSPVDYPALLKRRERKAELDPALEAFTMSWRPAGSMSLAERWLRAGETEDAPRRAPRPPAPPKDAKLRMRRLKK